jgi:TatD DNase family protein
MSLNDFWIDAHCHLDFPQVSDTLPSLLLEAQNHGVHGVILGGTCPKSWSRHFKFVTQYHTQKIYSQTPFFIWWSVGYHPYFFIHDYHKKVQKFESHDMDHDHNLHAMITQSITAMNKYVSIHSESILQKLSKTSSNYSPTLSLIHHQASAIGEIGMDMRGIGKRYAYAQQRLLEAQLDYAKQMNKPIVLHVVSAHQTVLDTLKRVNVQKQGGIIHAFHGSFELAQSYLKMGITPSIGMALTRAHSKKIRTCVTRLPLGSFVLETDSPDQPFQSFASTGMSSSQSSLFKPHGPARITDLAVLVADLKNKSFAKSQSSHKDDHSIKASHVLTQSTQKLKQIFTL